MEELLRRIQRCAGSTELYIVGGWLRDRLLRRPNRDLDLAVPGDPATLARKVARTLKGSFVVLDREHKIYRVALKDGKELDYIDFARFKGKDIGADLANRDFTINAMALQITGNGTIRLADILDPCDGKSDLKKRKLRMSSAAVFKDDPLRLMRAFRFAAELNFSIDATTSRAIKKNVPLISRSAAERVRDEFFRILSTDSAAPIVALMERSGLLEKILPEITQMKRSARRFYFHPHGLWQHAMETLVSLEMLTTKLDRIFPGNDEAVLRHLEEPLASGITRLGLLKFVALLHDVAKPLCARRIGKRMRFLGHEEKGAAMTGDILRRLRVGRKEIRIAERLVEHHMRPISLGQAKNTTQRAAFRLFRDLEENVPDLFLLSLADCYSYRRLKTKKTVDLKTQECTVRNLVAFYYEQKTKPLQPKLLDGNVLMRKLRLKPGPIIGKLLKAVTEAQQLGKIVTEEQALALARKRLTLLKK
jgi:tRNA nucleotidyltransferase/poly(A) polymerase